MHSAGIGRSERGGSRARNVEAHGVQLFGELVPLSGQGWGGAPARMAVLRQRRARGMFQAPPSCLCIPRPVGTRWGTGESLMHPCRPALGTHMGQNYREQVWGLTKARVPHLRPEAEREPRAGLCERDSRKGTGQRPRGSLCLPLEGAGCRWRGLGRKLSHGKEGTRTISWDFRLQMHPFWALRAGGDAAPQDLSQWEPTSL